MAEVSIHTFYTDILLLVVASRSDVHPVVGGKPRVGDTLRGLPTGRRSSVVMRGDALPHLPAIAPMVTLSLRDSTIVLMRMTFRNDAPIPHIRNVLVRKVRTHD